MGGATKFAGADDDGVIEHFACAQLADERGKGRIENGVLANVCLVVVGVGIPALQGDFHAAHAGFDELNGGETASSKLCVSKGRARFGWSLLGNASAVVNFWARGYLAKQKNVAI